MYNFKEFEKEDKWERFKALKEKMHMEALNDYFKELYDEATAKGETRAIVPLGKGVILKDGTHLTKKELDDYAKANGETTYPANESNSERFLRIMHEKE